MPQIDAPADFLAEIDERRRQLGLSERDLGRRAGLSHSAFWYAQKNEGDMSLRSALAYCNVLGLTVKVTKRRAG